MPIEQNADNGTIVTAPTCGACGVLPAVMKYVQDIKGFTDEQIIRGLAAVGIIGQPHQAQCLYFRCRMRLSSRERQL